MGQKPRGSALEVGKGHLTLAIKAARLVSTPNREQSTDQLNDSGQSISENSGTVVPGPNTTEHTKEFLGTMAGKQ
jgi:hypothetical protein